MESTVPSNKKFAGNTEKIGTKKTVQTGNAAAHDLQQKKRWAPDADDFIRPAPATGMGRWPENFRDAKQVSTFHSRALRNENGCK